MNAAPARPPALCCFHDHRRRRLVQSPTIRILSSLFRPNRRRRRLPPDPLPRRIAKPSPSPDSNVEFSIDTADITDRASAAVSRVYRSSEARLRRVLSSGADAYHDLCTSVSFDHDHRLVFSCRRSSLLFLQNLLLWALATVVAVRLVASLGFRPGWGFGDRQVVRRDRSLSGREVVVGRRYKGSEPVRATVNPLSFPKGTEFGSRGSVSAKRKTKREELPEWWVESVVSPMVSVGKPENQMEADRFVREIMDNRMSGKDFKDDDIVQLRQICRISSARVSFETVNARDSFYRAAVDLVLKICSRLTEPTTTVLIDGEEARHFICGLAYNIGLENVHAARIVRAAVAARTRSLLLQSWALEVQGKRSEALEELSKICQIHRFFPAEEFSPEMEMVAAGLKKNLRVEQREHLLNLFKGICTGSQRTAAEALGLVDSS